MNRHFKSSCIKHVNAKICREILTIIPDKFCMLFNDSLKIGISSYVVLSILKNKQQLIRPILVRVQYISNWYFPATGPHIWP